MTTPPPERPVPGDEPEEAPETPTNEPKPEPVQDPPAEPGRAPYVVDGQLGSNRSEIEP
jgi:hypothetical protein